MCSDRIKVVICSFLLFFILPRYEYQQASAALVVQVPNEIFRSNSPSSFQWKGGYSKPKDTTCLHIIRPLELIEWHETISAKRELSLMPRSSAVQGPIVNPGVVADIYSKYDNGKFKLPLIEWFNWSTVDCWVSCSWLSWLDHFISF